MSDLEYWKRIALESDQKNRELDHHIMNLQNELSESRSQSEKLAKALNDIIVYHKSIESAQKRHYSQDYYENMRNDGVTYDVSFLATFRAFEICNEALQEYNKGKET